MGDGKHIICQVCKKPALISDIRYVIRAGDTTIAACAECRVKGIKPEKSEAQKEEALKRSFMCERCHYKFRYNPEKVIDVKCPYCGKADKVVEHRPTSAANIVRSS